MTLNHILAHKLPVSIRRLTAVIPTSPVLLALGGCSFSPSIDVMGSYFPGWIVCCVIAIGVTTSAHYLFSRWNLVTQLWPLALLYPCLICFVSCLLWLVLFR